MTTTAQLSSLTTKIRSKNAGPFWVTLDLFFPTTENYAMAAAGGAISESDIATLYSVEEKHVKIFRIPTLRAIKISFARPHPQGSVHDRDIHAAQQYIPLLDFEVPVSGRP